MSTYRRPCPLDALQTTVKAESQDLGLASAVPRHLQRWSYLDSCLNRLVFGIADASEDVQFGARLKL